MPSLKIYRQIFWHFLNRLFNSIAYYSRVIELKNGLKIMNNWIIQKNENWSSLV